MNKLVAPRNRRVLGATLVVLQLGCMLLLTVLAVPAALRRDLPPDAIALAVSAISLFVWILMHNRLGNFNIRPLPKNTGVLVTSGPYRWVRHPMYSAVLLGAAALARLTMPALGWSLWLVLALVLWIKARLEEQWMQEQHAGYSAYMLDSKRFIPLVY